MKTPFNKPYLMEKGLEYITQAFENGHVSGDGPFTLQCNRLLEEYTGARKVLLTHSCTAALEMAAILAGIGEGDEVILPSYTFVSTANAFVLRGAKPVFVDIRPDTLTIDEKRIEAAITPKTKAIAVVHYAGVACEMNAICSLAEKHGLLLIEDAAQALGASYQGRPLGTFGQLATLSFHETKNIICGEGGALLINDERFFQRAEIIREKGTNRSQFFRGAVDKYTWVDVGSSYLPSDILAAFLLAQLESVDTILERRRALWIRYDTELQAFQRIGIVRCPVIPADAIHNAHIYYLLFNTVEERNGLLAHLKEQGILSVFHYIPLHSAPAGKRYGRVEGSMRVTDATADTIARLPLYHELSDEVQARIIATTIDYLESIAQA